MKTRNKRSNTRNTFLITYHVTVKLARVYPSWNQKALGQARLKCQTGFHNFLLKKKEKLIFKGSRAGRSQVAPGAQQRPCTAGPGVAG